MKEKDLQIYDVWEAPTGNMFIKLTDEYSIAIGAKGDHAPSETWNELKKTQFVKANDITDVKRVGKLVFDLATRNPIDTLTQNDWGHMHDCVLVATWDGTTEGNLKRIHLNNEQLRVLFDTLPVDMQLEAYKYGMSDTVWRDKFIEYYTKNCM